MTLHTAQETDWQSRESLPVNPEHMVQHFIEQDQGNIQFFFIEDLQPSLDIVS